MIYFRLVCGPLVQTDPLLLRDLQCTRRLQHLTVIQIQHLHFLTISSVILIVINLISDLIPVKLFLLS